MKRKDIFIEFLLTNNIHKSNVKSDFVKINSRNFSKLEACIKLLLYLDIRQADPLSLFYIVNEEIKRTHKPQLPLNKRIF